MKELAKLQKELKFHSKNKRKKSDNSNDSSNSSSDSKVIHWLNQISIHEGEEPQHLSNLGFKEFTSCSNKCIKKEELKTNKEFNRLDELVQLDKYSEK